MAVRYKDRVKVFFDIAKIRKVEEHLDEVLSTSKRLGLYEREGLKGKEFAIPSPLPLQLPEIVFIRSLYSSLGWNVEFETSIKDNVTFIFQK